MQNVLSNIYLVDTCRYRWILYFFSNLYKFNSLISPTFCEQYNLSKIWFWQLHVQECNSSSLPFLGIEFISCPPILALVGRKLDT